jgi:hypothetical protein
MSQQLINHSPDLKRLRDEGYEIEVRGGYLLIHHVPYVNNSKVVQLGTLVTNLTMAGNVTARPNTHVIYFSGEHPCNMDGTIITAIQHSSQPQNFGNNIVVNHSFSNKPAEGYPDYYQKVKRYAEIIAAPAKAIDDTATEKTFKPVDAVNSGSVFKYIDTNSSRANINLINAKLEGQKVAIIGTGGTGAYVLDLLAKTPVREIHVYDGDKFLQHNAFRSPGAAPFSVLEQGLPKAEYFTGIYSHMHSGIVAHPYYLKADKLSELDLMTFVFLCIDNNASRKVIIDYLLARDISFIDVGLGVNIVGDKLIGGVRVTAATTAKHDHLANRIPGEENDNNAYATNIQIADLNSLNASMAVIKWKKLCGFYQDLEQEHHSSYDINVNKIFNEDDTA